MCSAPAFSSPKPRIRVSQTLVGMYVWICMSSSSEDCLLDRRVRAGAVGKSRKEGRVRRYESLWGKESVTEETGGCEMNDCLICRVKLLAGQPLWDTLGPCVPVIQTDWRVRRRELLCVNHETRDDIEVIKPFLEGPQIICIVTDTYTYGKHRKW